MSFENLRIYGQALEGVGMIYKLTSKPLFARDFSIKDQIRRASASVVANIAEGYGRKTKKDRDMFYAYSSGSVNEVVAFLDIISTIYPRTNTSGFKDFYKTLGRQIYAFRQKTT